MYDTLIIGSDLSALIAALVSKHDGMKTVLVTERDPDRVYAEQGYTFSANPLPLPSSNGFERINNNRPDLHLFPDSPLFPEPLQPCFQVISPEYRLDFFQGAGKWIHELTREFPSRVKALSRLFHSLENAGARIAGWQAKPVNRSSKGFTEKIFPWIRHAPFLFGDFISLRRSLNDLDGTFRGVLEAALTVLASLDLEDQPFPLSAAYMLSAPWQGIFSPLGGRSRWMRELYHRFEAEGGVLLKGCEMIRLETDPGVIADLNISGTPVNLRSRCLIVSTQWEKIDQLLLDRKCFHHLKRRIKSIPCKGYPFSLHMGIYEAGLPERLSPYVVWIRDPQKPARGTNCLFLDTGMAGDKGLAPTGRRAMTATVFLPHSPLVLGDDELRNVAREIFGSLLILLPFLPENLDFLHVENSIRFSRDIQEVVQRKYASGKRSIIGLNTLTPKTNVSHVFLTGGLLRPGLGFEGEILSGIEVASLARDTVQQLTGQVKFSV